MMLRTVVQEYFVRLLSGEVISRQMIPKSFKLKDHSLSNASGVQVLDCGVC